MEYLKERLVRTGLPRRAAGPREAAEPRARAQPPQWARPPPPVGDRSASFGPLEEPPPTRLLGAGALARAAPLAPALARGAAGPSACVPAWALIEPDLAGSIQTALAAQSRAAAAWGAAAVVPAPSGGDGGAAALACAGGPALLGSVRAAPPPAAVVRQRSPTPLPRAPRSPPLQARSLSPPARAESVARLVSRDGCHGSLRRLASGAPRRPAAAPAPQPGIPPTPAVHVAAAAPVPQHRPWAARQQRPPTLLAAHGRPQAAAAALPPQAARGKASPSPPRARVAWRQPAQASPELPRRAEVWSPAPPVHRAVSSKGTPQEVQRGAQPQKDERAVSAGPCLPGSGAYPIAPATGSYTAAPTPPAPWGQAAQSVAWKATAVGAPSLPGTPAQPQGRLEATRERRAAEQAIAAVATAVTGGSRGPCDDHALSRRPGSALEAAAGGGLLRKGTSAPEGALLEASARELPVPTPAPEGPMLTPVKHRLDAPSDGGGKPSSPCDQAYPSCITSAASPPSPAPAPR